MKRIIVGVVLATLLLLGGMAVTGQQQVTQIDDNHALATDWAVNEYEKTGYVEGDVDTYDMQLAIAENVADVGADTVVQDVSSEWVRIEYQEGIERTLRIHLPADYAKPYERSDVESVTSDHTADLEPVRDGEYLQISVDVDGPATIVLPLEWDGQVSYGILDRLESRADSIISMTPLDSSANWTYLDQDDLHNQSTLKVANHTDVLVQVDANANSSSTRWIPAKKDAADAPVYHFERENGNGNWSTYVVATTSDPPDVRFSTGGHGRIDKWRAEVNSAMEVPGEILDSVEVPDWVPVIG